MPQKSPTCRLDIEPETRLGPGAESHRAQFVAMLVDPRAGYAELGGERRRIYELTPLRCGVVPHELDHPQGYGLDPRGIKRGAQDRARRAV